MIPAKRLSAAVLAALLFATSIAMCGCDAGGGDKKGKNGKVPGDGKWYSVHKATVGGQYADAPDVEYFSTKYVGTADGLAIFHVEVQKSVPKGQDPMTADYNELQKSFFEFYGKDGSMVDSIDLRQKIDESGIFELDPKDYSELIKTIRTDVVLLDSVVSSK